MIGFLACMFCTSIFSGQCFSSNTATRTNTTPPRTQPSRPPITHRVRKKSSGERIPMDLLTYLTSLDKKKKSEPKVVDAHNNDSVQGRQGQKFIDMLTPSASQQTLANATTPRPTETVDTTALPSNRGIIPNYLLEAAGGRATTNKEKSEDSGMTLDPEYPDNQRNCWSYCLDNAYSSKSQQEPSLVSVTTPRQPTEVVGENNGNQ